MGTQVETMTRNVIVLTNKVAVACTLDQNLPRGDSKKLHTTFFAFFCSIRTKKYVIRAVQNL